ncbi:MAG TPA: hypothetical protein VFU81_03000, partial [Thermomicrobiales bacterium]|nr:hypothetical protein [Thermomicrobiales bacterium]
MTTHRVSRRAALQLGAAVAGAALLPAPRRRASAQGKTLTFWNPGIYPTQDPNDKTKPLDAFYIYQAAKRFGDAHGVEVKIEEQPSDETQFGKYRTASVAKNGPDVMGMWSGSYMLSVKEFLEPLGS